MYRQELEGRTMKRSILSFVAALWAMALVLGCGPTTSSEDLDQDHNDPLLSKAESLTPQSGQGSSLKTAFNDAADKVRLMLLLSPT